MANIPEPTRQLLKNEIFQDIHRRLDFHAELLWKVRQAVPGPMARHCLYCVVREDRSVVVYTDSQAFASQLRFFAPTILAKLNAAGDLAVSQVQIRNLSPDPKEAYEKTMVPMKKPTSEIIGMVKASSVYAPTDELKAALARLGETMECYAKK